MSEACHFTLNHHTELAFDVGQFAQQKRLKVARPARNQVLATHGHVETVDDLENVCCSRVCRSQEEVRPERRCLPAARSRSRRRTSPYQHLPEGRFCDSAPHHGSFLRRLAHLQRVPMRAQLLRSPSQPGQTQGRRGTSGHKRGTNSTPALCLSGIAHPVLHWTNRTNPKTANAFEAAPASRHLPRTCRSIPATCSLVLLFHLLLLRASLLCSVLELLLRFYRHMHVRGLLLQGFLGHAAIVDVDKSPEHREQRDCP